MTNSHSKKMNGNSKALNSTINTNTNGQRYFINSSPNNQRSNDLFVNKHKRNSMLTTTNSTNNIDIPKKYNNTISNNGTSSLPARSSSCSPPNFAFYAGSKCFDSPSANDLPKPPQHWTSTIKKADLSLKGQSKCRPEQINKTLPKTCATEYAASNTSEGINDLFSYNLKMMLNVKA
ncbi:unnamed protein product [Diamesa serratosioi]